jgi:hypothetical protein
MFNLKKFYKILKDLNMFFRWLSIKISIEPRKVLIMFQRKFLKDGRKFKRTLSFLNLGGCRIKNRRYKLNFGFINLTIMIMNIIWLRGRSLVNISYTRRRYTYNFPWRIYKGTSMGFI